MKRNLKTTISILLSVILCFASLPHAFAYDITQEDSTEEEYEFILGDVNSDGKVTTADAKLVLCSTAKLATLNDSQLVAADYNEDGKVTVSDARYILRVSAKLDPYGKSTIAVITSAA